MNNNYEVNKQWSSRPSDERYLDLPSMLADCERTRMESTSKVVSSRKLEFVPDDDHQGLTVQGPAGHKYAPTHWAFGQLAQLAGAPAGYLRSLPSDLSADLLNYGLKYQRGVEDVGVLLQKNGVNLLRAATGPNYGRIWNADVLRPLINAVGDGITGQWRVPGIWGKQLAVNTKETTSFFRSQQDFFVFLCDEVNRIEVPNRRDGKTGGMARGFIISQSEVGAGALNITSMYFDAVCQNRIIWNVQGEKKLSIRHTASAPDKFLEQVIPQLEAYSNSGTTDITQAIANAKEAKIKEDIEDFLAKRFTRKLAASFNAIHLEEEGRPIETLWDATTAVTAYARSIPHQNERVVMERKGGELLELAQ